MSRDLARFGVLVAGGARETAVCLGQQCVDRWTCSFSRRWLLHHGRVRDRRVTSGRHVSSAGPGVRELPLQNSLSLSGLRGELPRTCSTCSLMVTRHSFLEGLVAEIVASKHDQLYPKSATAK